MLLLISAAHTCRHRELAGVQIDQRPRSFIIKKGGLAAAHRSDQSTTLPKLLYSAWHVQKPSSSSIQYRQTAVHSQAMCSHGWPQYEYTQLQSHLLPMSSTRLPASIHVRPAYTQPRQLSTSSAQRPSSAQRNVPLMLVRSLLCRLS